MSLTNAQYDEIMRGYQTRQLRNRRLTQERMDTVYKQLPQLKTIQDAIASTSVDAARKKIQDDGIGYDATMKTLADLKKEKDV